MTEPFTADSFAGSTLSVTSALCVSDVSVGSVELATPAVDNRPTKKRRTRHGHLRRTSRLPQELYPR